MLRNEFPPSFPLRLMHKDIALALDLAKQHGLTLPAAAAAYSAYDAVKKASTDDPDYAAVARFWKKP
jgi:3-hydroxyisobutyrate dehydrogenase-like beta-hydroxyacid dehydrogenase